MRFTPATLLGGVLALVASLTQTAATQETHAGAPRSGFYVVPFVIYSPETSWIFGVGGAGYFHTSADTARKPSTCAASVQYSINGQYLFDPNLRLYLDEGRTLVETQLRLVRSFEVYYGIGNDAPELDEPRYEMVRVQVRVEFLRQIGNLLLVGPLGEFANESLRDPGKNPLLLAASAPGQNLSRTVGAGFVLLHDGRDRVYSPTRGVLARLRCVGYPKWLGSEAGFNWIEADIRHYLSLGKEQILAFQLFGEAVGGDVPFFRLPALGGEERMRGVLRGRYRDRASFVAQTEFRTSLYWKLGGVLFASVGEVAASPGRFALRGLRHSAGIGVRFTIDEREKLKLRLDYGVGPGTDGFYLTVDEAF